MTTNRLRVGLLLDDTIIDKWVAQAIKQLVADTVADVTFVVVNEAETSLASLVEKAYSNPWWTGLAATERLAWKLGKRPEFRKPVPLSALDGLGCYRQVSCQPQPADGFGNQLPKDVVAEIAGQTDIVVRFGFGVLKGTILKAPKHGVLSFHHGDLRKYRGPPAGFWEFLNDENEAGVTLQRLTEGIDSGSIVAYHPVDIADAYTWQEVKRRLFETSVPMLARGVSSLNEDPDGPSEPSELGELNTFPNAKDVLQYLGSNAIGRAKLYLEEETA